LLQPRDPARPHRSEPSSPGRGAQTAPAKASALPWVLATFSSDDNPPALVCSSAFEIESGPIPLCCTEFACNSGMRAKQSKLLTTTHGKAPRSIVSRGDVSCQANAKCQRDSAEG